MTAELGPRVGIFPGSFDPLTLGHEDIARRALGIVDRLILAVAHHPSSRKTALFDVQERLDIIREVFVETPTVEAAEFSGLLVDFARDRHATVVIRGLRGPGDLEYELRMAQMNRSLSPGLETVFLAPEPERSFVSATLIREVAGHGGDVSRFVSTAVLRRMRGRIGTSGP